MKRIITGATLVALCALAGALGGITTSGAQWFQETEPLPAPAEEIQQRESVLLSEYESHDIQLIPPSRPDGQWMAYNGSTYELELIVVQIKHWEFDEDHYQQRVNDYMNTQGLSLIDAHEAAKQDRFREPPTHWRSYEMPVIGNGRPRSDIMLDGPISVWGSRHQYNVVKVRGYRTELTDRIEDLADQMLENMTPPVYEDVKPGPT